jgi:hypothetical protein
MRTAEHPVAEGVAAAWRLDQHMPDDRLAEQLDQLLLRFARHRCERVVVDPATGDRGHLQHPLRGLGQRLHPGQQQVPQRLRELGAVGVGGRQLLGEERVAVRSIPDVGDQPKPV